MSDPRIVQLLATIADQDDVIIQLTRERDRARAIACRLEQELAHREDS